MARPSKGWSLYKPREGYWRVRFTLRGERWDVATREEDRRAAEARAAQIYVGAVRGTLTRPRRASTPTVALETADAAAMWLESLATTHAAQTSQIYATYCMRWHATWPNVDGITSAAAAEFTRARLGQVSRSSVRKELSALRGFLAWCVERGHLPELPAVAPPPPRAPGVRAVNRKERATDLSAADVDRLLAELPEWSSAGVERFAVRAFFVVLWETGLRPSTVARLSAPEHFRRGAVALTVTAQIDKARFARELPLTERARAALEAALPAGGGGLLFGVHDYRPFLRAAARRAGLKQAQVRTLTPYDLRHARTTHLVETSGNLLGVAYLVGHRQITTTNRYSHAQARHAAAVLATAGGSGEVRPTSPESSPPAGQPEGAAGEPETAHGAKGGT